MQGENGDLKNRGLKVELNHIGGPAGSGEKGNGGDGISTATGAAADNFPDSSIGEGMDITIQGANGHVKNHGSSGAAGVGGDGDIDAADNQSLRSDDSRAGEAAAKLNKYSDTSIGMGMDISIRGDGDANNKDAAAGENGGWREGGMSQHGSLQFDEKEALDMDELGGVKGGSIGKGSACEDDILSHTEIKKVEAVMHDPVDDVVVEECCPDVCYRVCPCCIGDPDSPFWQLWYRHRLQISRHVKSTRKI